MDLEIQFLLKHFTEKDPKLLMEHIQRMASGGTPFLPRTLSLVYDKLIEKVFVRSTATGAGPGKPVETGGQGATGPEPAPPAQASNPSSGVDPSPAPVPPPSTQQAELEPEPVPPGAVWLQCFKCHERARVQDLYDNTRCPRCPSRGGRRGRPYMQCPSCDRLRTKPLEHCARNACQARFV